MDAGPASEEGDVTRRSGDSGGFTLLEVVAVMAIIGLLLTVALPGLPRAVSRPQLEGIATRVAALLDGDRRAAMLRHQEVASIVDARRRLVRSGAGGPTVVLPGGVGITAALARTCLGASAADRIVFLPSGMSCGGAIALARSGEVIDVKVNWLTGTSTIAARIP